MHTPRHHATNACTTIDSLMVKRNDKSVWRREEMGFRFRLKRFPDERLWCAQRSQIPKKNLRQVRRMLGSLASKAVLRAKRVAMEQLQESRSHWKPKEALSVCCKTYEQDLQKLLQTAIGRSRTRLVASHKVGVAVTLSIGNQQSDSRYQQLSKTAVGIGNYTKRPWVSATTQSNPGYQ